ncbi:hypothetical protein [Nocardia brasiliensis]|uniref:hypothetical protein n=1 Tax=Nocardia brasiliensis TaxID=37326 RepID=UPI003D8ACCC1
MGRPLEPAGPYLMEKVEELAAIAPRLHRSLLDGFGGPLAEATIGYRDWALLTLAVLTGARCGRT